MKKTIFMKLLKFLVPVFFVLFGLIQCKPLAINDQGVTGNITWIEGNQMPKKTASGEPLTTNLGGIPVKRIVRIYPLLNISDVSMENGLIQNLAYSPITEVESDENGNYSLQLNPGRYSVFTVEVGGLFANVFDSQGNIQPFTIREGEWIRCNILIDYQAVF